METPLTRFRVPPPPRLPPVLEYALAVALPPAALLMQLALRPWTEPIPFVLFFFVVSLASSIGGWGPGLVSVAVSAACGYSFLAGSPTPLRAAGALVGTAIFVPVASCIAALGALVRTGFREREDAAARLGDAVRARDDFISMASHELRTPLTSLSLNVQQLLRRKPGPAAEDELARRLAAVRRQIDRLALLVNNMLDVSRVTSGRIDLSPEAVDLAALARDVASRLEGDLEQARSPLHLEADAPLVGSWDRMRLEQVITNLLSNAAKYGGGHPIRLSVRRRDGTAVLEVADEGVGIAPEHQSSIFERFERGGQGQAPGGFGLGLWIVREIVRAMEGTVEVTSAPGEGSIFTVKLPLSRGDA